MHRMVLIDILDKPRGMLASKMWMTGLPKACAYIGSVASFTTQQLKSARVSRKARVPRVRAIEVSLEVTHNDDRLQ